MCQALAVAELFWREVLNFSSEIPGQQEGSHGGCIHVLGIWSSWQAVAYSWEPMDIIYNIDGLSIDIYLWFIYVYSHSYKRVLVATSPSSTNCLAFSNVPAN